MEISNLQGCDEDNFIDGTNQVQAEGAELDDTNQVQAEGAELDDTNQVQVEGAEPNNMWNFDDFNSSLTLHDFESFEDYDLDGIIEAFETESSLSTLVQAKQPILNSDQVDSEAGFKDQVAHDSNSGSTSFSPAQHKAKARNTKEMLNIKIKQKLEQEGKVIPIKDDESKDKLVIHETCLTEDDLRKDAKRKNRNKEAARRSRERKKSEEMSVKQRNCDLTKEVKDLHWMTFGLKRKLIFLCKGLGEIYSLKKDCIPDKIFLLEASSKINQVQASICQESIEQGSDHAIERYQAKMLPEPPWIDISKWSSAQPEDNGYWDASLSNDTGETSSTNHGLCMKDTSSNQTAEQGLIAESNDRAVNLNGYDNVKSYTGFTFNNKLFETHNFQPAFQSEGTGMQGYGFENAFFQRYPQAFIDQAGLKNRSHLQAAVAGQDTDYQSSLATSVFGKNSTDKSSIYELTKSNRASNATLGTNGASFALSDGNASNCNPWSVGDKPTEKEPEYQELVRNLFQGYKTPSQPDDCQSPVEKKLRLN